MNNTNSLYHPQLGAIFLKSGFGQLLKVALQPDFIRNLTPIYGAKGKK